MAALKSTMWIFRWGASADATWGFVVFSLGKLSVDGRNREVYLRTQPGQINTHQLDQVTGQPRC